MRGRITAGAESESGCQGRTPGHSASDFQGIPRLSAGADPRRVQERAGQGCRRTEQSQRRARRLLKSLLPGGVMVTQQNLDLLFQVRILAGQPLSYDSRL